MGVATEVSATTAVATIEQVISPAPLWQGNDDDEHCDCG